MKAIPMKLPLSMVIGWVVTQLVGVFEKGTFGLILSTVASFMVGYVIFRREQIVQSAAPDAQSAWPAQPALYSPQSLTSTPFPVTGFCKYCGATNPLNAPYCGKCGKEIRGPPAVVPPPTPAVPVTAPRFCGQCGSPMSLGQRFCGKCRAPA